MVEQFTFQTLFQFLQTLSIMVGIAYYLMILHNQQKTQKISTETRQIQYLLNLVEQQIVGSPEDFQQIMSQEWSDFDDFLDKYSVGNNPENYRIRNSIWRSHNTAGLMVRDGLIDVKTYIEYLGDTPIQVWMKYEDIIKEFRSLFELPNYMIGMEILAKELNNYREENGWKTKPQYQFTQNSS